MLAPFDPNGYRKRVLAAVLARGGGDSSDPFELYDLPLEHAERLDDAAVARHLEEVWGFWQRHRDHPKYAALAADLVADHQSRAQLLLPAHHRAATARTVRAQREARDADRFALLDASIRALVSRHGGLPRAKLAHLTTLGRSTGLSAAEAEARIARHRVLDEAPAPATPSAAEDARRRQIRALLDELGTIWDCAPPVTLFALLDLEPDADDRHVALAAEACRARAREMAPTRLRTVLDEVLIHVADLLERGPLQRERYLDAVALDVAERLRPQVLAAVLVEDALTAEDAQVLTAQARALGLDSVRAGRVPRDLAVEAGVPVQGPATTPVVDRAPTIDYRRRRAPYAKPLQEARAALRAGDLPQAQRKIAEALAAAGAEPPPAVTAVRDEIAEALAALEAVPVPSEVTVSRAGDSVHVCWRPAPGADLTYRVQRRRPDGSWHTVGRTSACELSDGGAPPEDPVSYQVVALWEGRVSAPAAGSSP